MGRFQLSCLALAMACLSSPAHPQPGSPFASLSIPSGVPLRCRVLTPAAHTLSHARHGYEFEIGNPLRQHRSINVWYDSAGAPVTLTESTNPDSTKYLSLSHSVAAKFMGDLVGGLLVVYDGELPDSIRMKPPAESPLLNERQQRDAITLATWLWQRRCGGR